MSDGRREKIALKAVNSQRFQLIEFLQTIDAFGNTAALRQLAVVEQALYQRQCMWIALKIIHDTHIQLVAAKADCPDGKHYAAV